MGETIDWEQCYRDRETPWDEGMPSPGLTAFLERHTLAGKGAVPGCGYGHDAAAIACHSPNATVVALDLAPTAVAAAAGNLRPFANATALQADLFDLEPVHEGAYDWVWEHTCFCAIDPGKRPRYVEAVHRMLRPGGMFLGVFYLNPRPREDGVGGPPFGCTPEELDALFLPRFVEEASWLPEETYPGREGRELMRLLRKPAGIIT